MQVVTEKTKESTGYETQACLAGPMIVYGKT